MDPTTLTDQDRANFVAYLDGELSPEAARALESKLQADPRARTEVDALRRAWQVLDHLPRPVPSAASASRTLQRLSVGIPILRPPGRRPRLGLALAAALMFALTLGYMLGRLAPHPPPAPTSPPVANDEILRRDRRVIENFSLYEKAADGRFLTGLADPADHDLFGDDSAES